MDEVRLWRKNSLGLGTWRIWGEGDKLIYAHSVVEGGAEIFHSDTISLNQSGRSLQQQMSLEANSRISRCLDKGYKTTRDEALKGSTNQLGLTNPMLAQPIDKVRVPQKLVNAYVQRKYDGHRCLITNQGGEIFAYTRKGKPVETIPHILNEVANWLPEGFTIDGELYIHGAKLQSISSLIKRAQPGSKNLCYMAYDLVDKAFYSERFKILEGMLSECRHPQVVLTPTYRVDTLDEAWGLFRTFRAEGFEGAMLKLSTHPYQDAVRSPSIIKLKEWHDCEVTVLGATPSKEGWAVLRCRTDAGVEFDTSAPGSVPEKLEVMANIDKYVGQRLTIEFAYLTADGVPFHCAALRWREDL